MDGHHYAHFYQDPKFWVGVSFVLFVVLAAKPLFGKLLAALDARSARIKADIDAAQALRVEAEAMLKDAAARRDAAMAEAEQMLRNAREEAARLAEAARVDLATATARREKIAMDRIGAAEAQAQADVRAAAAEIAIAAARQVIASQLDHDRQAGLIDQAIADLPARLH